MNPDICYINRSLECLGYRLVKKPKGNEDRLRLSKIKSELGDMFDGGDLVVIMKKGSVEIYSPAD